jgi:2-aminoethylphosphonate-pyruvate transaminase
MTQKDPWLLTPGPLTTSRETKDTMLHDWGSRDSSFIETNQRIRENLVKIIDGQESYVCVPLQGSGTFAVEATIGTLLPPNGKALILINGAYGKRMVKILQYLNREYDVIETPEDTPPSIDDLDKKLSQDPKITHVLAVHCETTSGILNPLNQIGKIVAKHNRRLIIDAMSAFGAIPISIKEIQFDAVMASSNKCLEGVPGVGFAIIQKQSLEQCKGNSHSLSLDLYDQWITMEANAQWRFTPPTHVIMALDAAINQFVQEGGVLARHKRYSENCKTLISGMKEMGFETLLTSQLQAPIIVTFKMPKDHKFDFPLFYESLKEKNFVIYPGKLTVAPSFRIGCIGHIGRQEIRGALTAIKDTLAEMNIGDCSPE